MPDFLLSAHAIEQINNRGISQEIVFDVLANPDKIELEGEGQLIYQKVISFEGNDDYLVRIFVNSNKIPNLVKTVYRTSKFSKYQ